MQGGGALVTTDKSACHTNSLFDVTMARTDVFSIPLTPMRVISVRVPAASAKLQDVYLRTVAYLRVLPKGAVKILAHQPAILLMYGRSLYNPSSPNCFTQYICGTELASSNVHPDIILQLEHLTFQ